MNDGRLLEKQSAARRRLGYSSTAVVLGVLLLAGLALRLLVWRWHEQYPLGGDEREYFEQALTWLQGKGYRELPLMRPPLYTVFLAVIFQLFDSQVQRVRLVQALISTGTIALVWLWSAEIWGSYRSRAALVAAGLAALCYTFAANATELLTETIFVGGLTLAFWLLARAARPVEATNRRQWWWGVAAGLVIGALALVRSVALPLVPLGAVWLLALHSLSPTWNKRRFGQAVARSALFVLGSVVVILPWTLRNYALYNTPIIIDTTGAENLWLDNTLTDREAVKRELYAMGEDRGARQQLAMEQGVAAISADPSRFVGKMWGETKKFFALEYFDDLRRRPAIWVPPLEVWLRLLLGDGIWLVLLIAGITGLWLGPNDHVKLLLVPWSLYVLLTGLVFHVELRYRLPLYPALLPYAAWSTVQVVTLIRRRSTGLGFSKRGLGAVVTIGGAVTLLLLHRNYVAESALLLRKHYHIAQAWRAYKSGGINTELTAVNVEGVRAHAQAALDLDPRSALARVQLGLVAQPVQSQQWWQEAAIAVPAHPYAHLLLGNRLRQTGDVEAARRELAFETRSLEDLQQWSLHMFQRRSQDRLDIGDGLDLGAISGFYSAADGSRWTREQATVYRLTPGPAVTLRLRSPRPNGAPPARVRLLIDAEVIATLDVTSEWQSYDVTVPEHMRNRNAPIALTIQVQPFRPRAYDRANGDNRALGVEVDWVATGT